jgi:Zn finger protein HypA/HybF involved in hydrogenase expression
MGGIKELYKSLSSASNSGLARFEGLAYAQTKFYCMNCDYEHRKIACPKCGSKMIRAG